MSTGFYINLPLGGVAALILVLVRIPEQLTKPNPLEVLRTLHQKLDLIGFALFAPAAIQLLLALQYGGNQFPWDSATVIGLFCGAAGTFVVWAFWNWYKKDAAMIPLSMVGRRIVWTSCLSCGFLMSQLFCSSYYLPIYFQGIKDVTPFLSGLYLLPSIISQLITAVASGYLGKLDDTRLWIDLPGYLITHISG
jgi:hypothetical protein